MIKLMKYLKKSAGYIVLIIALLFLQAYCDLSLPDYTSKIINVGIQQKGIEDSVPDKLRDSTLQNLQIFMDEDQKKEVSQNYTQEEDTWVLNDDISKETRENLNEDFSKAMMMVAAFSDSLPKPSREGKKSGKLWMNCCLNAAKHSPASSARSTKRRVRGMLLSVGVESSH